MQMGVNLHNDTPYEVVEDGSVKEPENWQTSKRQLTLTLTRASVAQ